MGVISENRETAEAWCLKWLNKTEGEMEIEDLENS